MQTLKVFISQPMRDKTNEEILEERNKIKEFLIQKYKNDHLEFLDSFFPNLEIPDDVKTKKIYYLAKAIEMLSKADILFLAKGWDNYNGCNFEMKIFRTYKQVNEHTCIDGNLEDYDKKEKFMKIEKKNINSTIFNKLEIISLILDFLGIDEDDFFKNKDCCLDFTPNGKIEFSYWDIIGSEDEH